MVALKEFTNQSTPIWIVQMVDIIGRYKERTYSDDQYWLSSCIQSFKTFLFLEYHSEYEP